VYVFVEIFVSIEISTARFHFFESENSQISILFLIGACGIDWRIPYFQGKLEKTGKNVKVKHEQSFFSLNITLRTLNKNCEEILHKVKTLLSKRFSGNYRNSICIPLWLGVSVVFENVYHNS